MSLKAKRKPVIITIPVNLRKYFKSNTVRNFFNTITLEYKFEEGNDSLEEIIENVDKQLKNNLTKEKLSAQMNALAVLENVSANINNDNLKVEYDPNIEGDRANKINQFDNLKFSLSQQNNVAPVGNYNVYGKDIALETPENITEMPENSEKISETAPKNTVFDDYAPLTEEQANERDAEQSLTSMSPEEFEKLVQSYMDDAPSYMFDDDEIRKWAEEQARQNPQGPNGETVIPESPLADRDIETIGRDRKTNAYMYENPEVKPFFQEEAMVMLAELGNSTKGEKGRKGASYGLDEYEIGAGNEGWFGTKRQTSKEIEELLDSYDYSYKEIEKGLRAIIEDNGAENNAISKRIEFKIDERLREGYNYFGGDEIIPPNQEYINLLNEKQITEYSDEAFNIVEPEFIRILKDAAENIREFHSLQKRNSFILNNKEIKFVGNYVKEKKRILNMLVKN